MDKIAIRTRRVTRLWRAAFVGYGLCLTTATHWPGVRLEPGEGPSDKSLHLFAFSVFALLLWRTGWITRLSLVYLITLLWAGIDEFTQGLPVLDRFSTWQDFLANVLGITVMVTWIWVMKPVGGLGNRMRLSLHRFVFEEIFSQWKAWFVLGGGFLACALPVAFLWTSLAPNDINGPIYIALGVWIMTTLVIWSGIWRSHHRAAREEKSCFACGASCKTCSFDELGAGCCLACNHPIHAGNWLEPAAPSNQSLLRLAIGPGLIGVILLAAVIFVIASTVTIYGLMITAGYGLGGLPNLFRIMGTEPQLMFVADFAVIFIIFAIVTKLYRSRLARHYDQPFICRQCGHDLRGTPTSSGAGRCGECGKQFVRHPDQAGVAYVEQ